MKNEKKFLSLYIHIPFCESKCYYCNFVSTCARDEDKEKYVESLLKEIELYKDCSNYIIKTIFIGGGTPSVLKSFWICEILNKVKECFCLDKNVEITIECNPNSFNEEKAKAYKSCGINRISFGLQSANNKLLKQINRIHTKEDFVRAIKIAQKYNFNLNADILLGLPNQKLKDVKNTLKLLLNLKINHISCYSLILEEKTPLYKMVDEKKLELPQEETVVKMYDYTLKLLKKHKIFRYEVSNFAKNGYECKHNLVYWNLDDYLGLGLNSHSKIGNTRFENFSGFENYYSCLKENKKPIKTQQKLSFLEQKEEFIMLGLRKQQGINLKDYNKRFNESLEKEKYNQIEKLLKLNLIKLENNFLFATDLGFKVLNQIILELV